MRTLLMLLALSVGISGCASAASATPQASIPVSNAEGEVIASQPGPQWVLLSGVDEHGLMAEPVLNLLASPMAGSAPISQHASGTAASVLEIRHLGPQNLQRYFRVEVVDGESGWISDYYIRTQAYLFNIEGIAVPLHDSPGGTSANQVVNVTPVLILDPVSNTTWWLVRTIDEGREGWVLATFVKESSEEEFLMFSGAHDQDDPHE